MRWFKRFARKFVEELAWALFLHFLIPVGGSVVISLFTAFLARLYNLPWPLIGIIAILTFLATMTIVELKRSSLKIRFCAANGKFIEHNPEARYWKVSSSQTTYWVHGFFRLSNLSLKERTTEGAYVVLEAKGKELKRGQVHQFQPGKRIRSFDTTVDPVEFSVQLIIDEYELQRLVGLNYDKATMKLVVESTSAKAVAKFHNRLGHD